MVEAKAQYEVVHGGQAYGLSLRVSEDGFITAWQYGAVNLLMQGILGTDAAAPEEIFADETRINRLMNIITREGYDHVAGRKRLPWESWLELDPGVLRRIITDFFLSLGPKTRSLPDSESSTNAMIDLVRFCSEWWTLTTTSAARAPRTPAPPGEPTPEPAAT